MSSFKISELRKLYDSRSPREHVYFISITLIALIGLFDILFWTPSNIEYDKLNKQNLSVQKDINTFEEQINQIFQKNQNDPNASYRSRLQEINQQIDELNSSILNLNKVLISPRTMTNMLENVFQKHKNLNVVSITSVPEDQLNLSYIPQTPDNALYRHGIEIIVEGKYKDVMNYLNELQTLSWQIYWESLDYEINQYPNGKLTLIVYTLSLDKKWIGA